MNSKYFTIAVIVWRQSNSPPFSPLYFHDKLILMRRTCNISYILSSISFPLAFFLYKAQSPDYIFSLLLIQLINYNTKFTRKIGISAVLQLTRTRFKSQTLVVVCMPSPPLPTTPTIINPTSIKVPGPTTEL